MSAAHANRLERLRERVDAPLLVTGATNLAYLTGFRSTNAAVLVGPGPARLYADARYTQAGRAVAGVEFVETARVLLADLATRLDGPIAFEADHITYAGHQALAAGGLELVATRGLVEGLRARKDDEELAAIARASAMADRAFERLLEEPWVGRTEAEIARRLRMIVLDDGGDDVAFDVIVGSGPNGAAPHARPGERRVTAGDLVVVDFGVLVGGYRSDLARTVEVGAISAQCEEIIEVCLRAHETAIATIRPGMDGVGADAVARDIIDAAGYGANFGHALGHGIGREVHEAPAVSRISTDTIEAGQVVTIEPGIYLPGVAGVRIEDLCVVRDGGLESLTTLPKRIAVG